MKALYILFLLSPGVAEAICASEDFVRNEEARVTIGIDGRGYSPPCLSVRPGTAVTIQASGGHPLQGVPNGEGPANPFARGEPTTTPDTQTLDALGQFRYFCVRHGNAQGEGMAGEIKVE